MGKTATPASMLTRASSITRALDQIGDKWCLLILQEAFWGINTFSGMLDATGVSRGVLSERLKWLQEIDCLHKRPQTDGRRGNEYHLTQKSAALYPTGLMAIAWERKYFQTPELDAVAFRHIRCGHDFTPTARCSECQEPVDGRDIEYSPGPGATQDSRFKKVRRRSSLSSSIIPSSRSVYRNLINLVGDRWTANVIALAFHGHARFDEFHKELPVATNILSDRLRFLTQHGVFEARSYQDRPRRYEYVLTEKGWDLFPYFLTILQWGDRWCDPDNQGPPMNLKHKLCSAPLHGIVVCSHCGEQLEPFHVTISLEG